MSTSLQEFVIGEGLPAGLEHLEHVLHQRLDFVVDDTAVKASDVHHIEDPDVLVRYGRKSIPDVEVDVWGHPSSRREMSIRQVEAIDHGVWIFAVKVKHPGSIAAAHVCHTKGLVFGEFDLGIYRIAECVEP